VDILSCPTRALRRLPIEVTLSPIRIVLGQIGSEKRGACGVLGLDGAEGMNQAIEGGKPSEPAVELRFNGILPECVALAYGQSA
jgi:hypothetical protein